MKRKVKDLDLEEKVQFLGVRDDVPDLLNVMDVFVLPSRFEGFGIVFVEAQANGLKCFASDGVVPRGTNVCGGVTFLSLSQPPSFWAQKILSADITRMKDPVPAIRKGHFDIDTEAKNLKRMYKTLCQ